MSDFVEPREIAFRFCPECTSVEKHPVSYKKCPYCGHSLVTLSSDEMWAEHKAYISLDGTGARWDDFIYRYDWVKYLDPEDQGSTVFLELLKLQILTDEEMLLIEDEDNGSVLFFVIAGNKVAVLCYLTTTEEECLFEINDNFWFDYVPGDGLHYKWENLEEG